MTTKKNSPRTPAQDQQLARALIGLMVQAGNRKQLPEKPLVPPKLDSR